MSTPGDKARAAIALHAWYTGLETVLERILRELDREVPSGNASHRDIVFQATAELPQVRPAILPAALTDELLELLAFRHFFQHAYAAELDAGRLHVHLTRLLRICDEVDAAFIGFDTFIADALAATTRG